MSDDRNIFKKRVDEIWDEAIRSGGGIYEKAEYHFSEWVDDELYKLKPSQYAGFMEVAKENGYVPGEERSHWAVNYSKDDLEAMGFGE